MSPPPGALPEWLPDAVREIVAGGLFDLSSYPVAEKLLTNPRMKPVWERLRTEGRRSLLNDEQGLERRLNNLPQRYRRETWLHKALIDGAIPPVEPEEKACVSFFLLTAIIFTLKNPVVKKQEIEREANRWRVGAALNREALSGFHQARVDPALAASFSACADHCDRYAKSIETSASHSPYVIERNSRERARGADEHVRGQVCHLAEMTQELFGSPLHMAVATAASVAAGFEIPSKTVENWVKRY